MLQENMIYILRKIISLHRRQYYILIIYIIRMMLMPMVYVSESTSRLLNELLEHLKQNTSAPSRVLKTDVLNTALQEYAEKLGMKVK